MSTGWTDRWTFPAFDVSGLETILRLTLIDLLLRPMGFWAIRACILLVAAAALIHSRVLRAPVTWILLTAFIGWRLFDDWPLSDNHIYLLGYWCLTVCLALISKEGETILKKSSRLLLGLAFIFAVLWKGLLSSDYLDGRFFRVTFTLDERFAHTALLFGGLTEQQLIENREFLSPLPAGAELLNPGEFHEPAAFKMLVKFASWGTLIAEMLIAALFLLPLPERFVILRHISLLAFCAIIYAFAPVAGFGWLLLILGLTQTREDQKVLQGFYLAGYFLILIYSEVPWARLLQERFS